MKFQDEPEQRLQNDPGPPDEERIPRLPVGGLEQAGMRDFGMVLEQNFEKVREATIANAVRRGVVNAERVRFIGEENKDFRQNALFNDDWQPYLERLRAAGRDAAARGLNLFDWFRMCHAFRSAMVPLLFDAYADTRARFHGAIHAMDVFLDNVLAALAEEYVHDKESRIVEEQEKTSHLSTPVLQVRDQLLIVPLIGEVDHVRARQMTDQILRAIRTARAKAVVLDITGLPSVDSRVANSIVQTVEAARLMGASVFLTGISTQIAQTLVSLGADMGQLRTLGDLQSGIEEAEHLLGYSVRRGAPPEQTEGSKGAEREDHPEERIA